MKTIRALPGDSGPSGVGKRSPGGRVPLLPNSMFPTTDTQAFELDRATVPARASAEGKTGLRRLVGDEDG